MGSRRRSSLFNRWERKNRNEQFEGIKEEEMVEYKEAFHLFDKVSTFSFTKCHM